MAKYQTRQRRLLTEYLENHKDETVSVSDAAKALGDISLSALYRNFAALEAEGKVRRISRGGERNVCYQYTAAKECIECLHLNCKMCGRSYHLDHGLADIIIKGVAKTENFKIDKANTVIYGVCDTCLRG